MPPEETETKPQMTEGERRKIIRLMKWLPYPSALRGLINPSTGEIFRPDEAASILCVILNTMPEERSRERLIAAIVLRYVAKKPGIENSVALALSKALHNGYISKPMIATRRVGVAIFRAGTSAIIALMVLGIIAGLIVSPPVNSITRSVMLIIFEITLLLCSTLLFSSPIGLSYRNAVVQLAAAETLALLQLPDSVGALAKASRGTHRLANVTRNALVQLLPTLFEAHYGRLPNDATPELCALLLDSDTSEHLIMLTVEAIGKVGDGRAVEPMQTFAQTARTPKLREMAETILPILTARREQENASSTLLRHSSAPPVDAGQLLRAASASPATPPEQLLRPSAGTDAPPDSQG